MRFPIFSTSWSLLICASLCSSAAFAQSLSFVKKGDSNYWIEASAPLNNPYTLQASENLHLWIDFQNGLQQQYSSRFDNAGVTRRYLRLTPATPPPPPIRVMLIGDSMTADCCGWGAGIYGYFNVNATVVNYADAWTSTKVFLTSDNWDKMLIVKPDYVLIQFGFEDGSSDVDRNTTIQEFGDNLRTIVQTVRGFNGVPILVTLHAARLWDAQGMVVPAWQSRNDVVKQVASEVKAPLIDLNQSSMALLNQLGASGSMFMEKYPGDNMHLSPLGGQYFARLVVNALPDNLGPYLTGIFDQPPKP